MTKSDGPNSFAPSWKQVATYLDRAETEHGVVRKRLADKLGVSSPALSGWTTDNDQSKISLDKLRSFARETHMTRDELVQLVFTRLYEKDGTKLQLDVDLLADAFSYLLPTPEEQRVLDIYNETFREITFSVFVQTEYRERLANAMKSIASEAVSEHLAEARAQ